MVASWNFTSLIVLISCFCFLPCFMSVTHGVCSYRYLPIFWPLFETKFNVRIEQDQLHEREQYILELEMKLNDKERELNALKIDHQTVSGLLTCYNIHSKR